MSAAPVAPAPAEGSAEWRLQNDDPSRPTPLSSVPLTSAELAELVAELRAHPGWQREMNLRAQNTPVLSQLVCTLREDIQNLETAQLVWECLSILATASAVPPRMHAAGVHALVAPTLGAWGDLKADRTVALFVWSWARTQAEYADNECARLGAQEGLLPALLLPLSAIAQDAEAVRCAVLALKHVCEYGELNSNCKILKRANACAELAPLHRLHPELEPLRKLLYDRLEHKDGTDSATIKVELDEQGDVADSKPKSCCVVC